MRVAFISDIHANFPALAAALTAAERLGAARIVAAGDVAAGGPHPAECVRLLMAQEIPCIRGNVENKLLALTGGRGALKKAKTKKKTAALAWTIGQLSAAEIDWLAALPAELTLKFGGAETLVVHGSPLSDIDYIFASVTAEGLRAKLGERRPAALICGHSHVPFVKSVAGVRVINCGAVGHPVDGDPRGSFALVDFAKGRVAGARIVRFAYPLDNLVADLARLDLPFFDANEYRLGVKNKGG